ncbi:MAG: hypothetical protein HY746_06780 [Elusimicrobia bacterium]|nr:hypothetical protein [Elusimicrobiota bacterium]
MKKILAAITIISACSASHAIDFNDLTIKNSELKDAAEAIVSEPAVSEKNAPATLGEPAARSARGTDCGQCRPVPAAANAAQSVDPKWYGKDSRKAYMTFTTYMLYKIPSGYTGSVYRILYDKTQLQKISDLVRLQLQHMYGAFTMHPQFVNTPGIPSGDYKFKYLSVEESPGRYAKVTYSYEDYAVFARSLFNNAGSKRIAFVLPKDPATIYQKGFTSGSSTNRCTDAHYNSEDDFWYFWNPYQRGCPIKEDDLVTVQSDLQMLDVTRHTYPEYQKLYGNNGNGDVLQITYLVGVDENFNSGDLGRQTFLNSFEGLQAGGFEVTLNEARHKRLSMRTPAKRSVIDMYLVNPNNAEFAKLAVNGMKTSDIFLYDGHSGLGGHLHPDRLAYDTGEQLTLPKNKYQIFYFNGCSTYAYYNSAYFQMKRTSSDPGGTKNLDIITTGIGASFSTGSKVDVTFLATIATGQRPSWQTILDRINAAEGSYTALTHVNGDEDNPKTQ